MHKSSSEVEPKSSNLIKKTFNAIWKRKVRRQSVSTLGISETLELDKNRQSPVRCRPSLIVETLSFLAIVRTCFNIGQNQSVARYSTRIINMSDPILLKIFSYLNGMLFAKNL